MKIDIRVLPVMVHDEYNKAFSLSEPVVGRLIGLLMLCVASSMVLYDV